MSKYILILAALVMIPTFALAQAPGPPSHNGYHSGGPAWGQDPENWTEYSGAWASPWLLYDISSGSSGYGWRRAGTGQGTGILPPDLPEWEDWPGLDIEVWFEMEAMFTWAESEVDVHRAGNYADIYVYFHGTLSSNNGQWIITTPPSGGSLDYIPYIGDQFNLDPTRGYPIPVTWEYSLDGGPWTAMECGSGGAYQFVVPACDHSYVVRACLQIDYHQPDGYYHLEGGSICPAEPT